MNSRRQQIIGGVVFGYCAIAMCTSCDASRGITDIQGSTDTGRPALHAIHHERIQTMMAEISHLATERLPQEMDTSALRERKSEELARCATKLAEDAKAIPDALTDVRISAEDRRVFVAFAEKLRSSAAEMATLARHHDAHAMAAKYNELMSTCNACHSTFRILPRITPS